MLYQEIRPIDFDEMYGNKAVISSLNSMLKSGSIPSSFLFFGPSGCGKTTLARIVAKKLGATENGIIDFNSANTRGIDTIREVSDKIKLSTILTNVRVFIFDECHKLTNDAQNAFLKILEDTPAQVYFILCSTEPDNLIKTIRTRCASFEVKALRPPEMKQLLTDTYSILFENKVMDEKLLNEIVKCSEGSSRKALMSLEKVMNMPDIEEAIILVASDMIDSSEEVIALCREIAKPFKSAGDDSAAVNKWTGIVKLYSKLKEKDPEKLRRAILGYFKTALLKAKNTDDMQYFYDILSLFNNPTYNSGEPDMIRRLFATLLLNLPA